MHIRKIIVIAIISIIISINGFLILLPPPMNKIINVRPCITALFCPARVTLNTVFIYNTKIDTDSEKGLRTTEVSVLNLHLLYSETFLHDLTSYLINQ